VQHAHREHPSVLARGILSHDNAAKLPHHSVAMQAIQDKRDLKSVPGGLKLHQYANLYFHARNPMLFKRRYEDVCVLCLSTAVFQLQGAVITDQNASSDYASDSWRRPSGDYSTSTTSSLAAVVRLGEPYLYEDKSGAKILNFPTKDHWHSASRLRDIEQGLNYLAEHYKAWGITSLSMSPLGCGNGGLEWSEVGPLIYRKLHGLPIDVEVFAPYGTPSTELKMDFLAAPAQLSLEGKGRRHEKMNPGWVTLIEVLKELEDQPYAPPVGRTIFQKICYVVTELGVPTGFEFGKGSYGPFSADVKPALHDLANRNWLQEMPLGRMVALRVGEQFEKERSKHLADIEKHRKTIDKTRRSVQPNKGYGASRGSANRSLLKSSGEERRQDSGHHRLHSTGGLPIGGIHARAIKSRALISPPSLVFHPTRFAMSSGNALRRSS
jgi:uncharacterized protein YwgA